jgi:hypothetical protein
MGYMQKYKIVVLHLFTLFKKPSIEEPLNKNRKVSTGKIVNFLFINSITPFISFLPSSPTGPFGPQALLLQIVKYTFNMVALNLDDAFFDRTAGTAHHFELLAHQC